MRILRHSIVNFGPYVRRTLRTGNIDRILIQGVNGSGKSQLRDSVLINLTSEVPPFPKNLTLAGYVRNPASADEKVRSARIITDFEHEGRSWRIDRVFNKTGKHDVTLHDLAGTDKPLSGVRAVKAKMSEIISVSKHVLAYVAFVPQGDMGKAISGTPTERRTVMLRLCGVDALDTVDERLAARASKLNANFEDHRPALASATENTDRLRTAAADIQLKAECLGTGLADSIAQTAQRIEELRSVSGLRARVEAVVSEIASAESKVSETHAEFAEPLTWTIADLESAHRNLIGKVIPEIKRRDQILSELETAAAGKKSADAGVAEAETAIRDHVATFGETHALESEIATLAAAAEQVGLIKKAATEYANLRRDASAVEDEVKVAEHALDTTLSEQAVAGATASELFAAGELEVLKTAIRVRSEYDADMRAGQTKSKQVKDGETLVNRLKSQLDESNTKRAALARTLSSEETEYQETLRKLGILKNDVKLYSFVAHDHADGAECPLCKSRQFDASAIAARLSELQRDVKTADSLADALGSSVRHYRTAVATEGDTILKLQAELTRTETLLKATTDEHATVVNKWEGVTIPAVADASKLPILERQLTEARNTARTLAMRRADTLTNLPRLQERLTSLKQRLVESVPPNTDVAFDESRLSALQKARIDRTTKESLRAMAVVSQTVAADKLKDLTKQKLLCPGHGGAKLDGVAAEAEALDRKLSSARVAHTALASAQAVVDAKRKEQAEMKVKLAALEQPGADEELVALVERHARLVADRETQLSLQGQLQTANRELTEALRRKSDLETLVEGNRRTLLALDTIKYLRSDLTAAGVLGKHLQNVFILLTRLCQKALANLNANFIVTVDPENHLSWQFHQDHCHEPLPAEKLSGGQRGKLGVAFLWAAHRLLCPDLGLLFMDEPSTFMDSNAVADTRDFLQHFAGHGSKSGGSQLWVSDHHEDLKSAFPCWVDSTLKDDQITEETT